MDSGRLRSIPSFITGVLNSYSQVFFSDNRIFAVILVAVTFIDVNAGISGLIAVTATNLFAWLIGFNRQNIRSGFYGFNSLLVSLGIGVMFRPGVEFFTLLVFVSLLTLLFTVMTEGIIGKYGLPFLSVAFLISIWLVLLATRLFASLPLSEHGIYAANEMYGLGGIRMVKIYDWFNGLSWHPAIKIYFRSLGAIFFQYHLFAGILVAVGLLIFSRISFVLSLLGFFSAYLFYHIIGADFNALSYGYIGFNFILTAIAIGGFFIIPSWYSFLWVVLLTPLVSVILAGTSVVFSVLQLSVYSLPFNITVLLFLYILKFRERSREKPEGVLFQQYSPEKNLYSGKNYRDRFGSTIYVPLSLPFMGEWKVTQAHNGDTTHKGEYRFAWDFEIADESGNTFSGKGGKKEDYYCFNKPVTAPADGWVEEILDGIDDNEIGHVNLGHNWGNTIVIRHSDHLYTKLCHLKKGSFKVETGSVVRKGDMVASCGNSGRSPVPHIHFQVQETPFIGSVTMEYPLAHFLRNKNGQLELLSWEKPSLNDTISNIAGNRVLEHAFHFIPGQKLGFNIRSSKKKWPVTWEIRADEFNQTYIYCPETRSKAYYKFEDEILCFTHFTGNRKSPLFMFYLGAYKILTGFYGNLRIRDTFSLGILNNRLLILFQDFIAPFYIFMKSGFELEYVRLDDDLSKVNARLASRIRIKVGNIVMRSVDFEFMINSEGIRKILVTEKNHQTEFEALHENPE